MWENEAVAVEGRGIRLVPYCCRHVPKYHGWMQSEELLAQTASEPLTLEQEHEMQRSWRVDKDKCTFILVAAQGGLPPPRAHAAAPVGAGGEGAAAATADAAVVDGRGNCAQPGANAISGARVTVASAAAPADGVGGSGALDADDGGGAVTNHDAGSGADAAPAPSDGSSQAESDRPHKFLPLTDALAPGPALAAALAAEEEGMCGDVNLFLNDPHDSAAAEIDVMVAEEWARGRGVGRQAVLLMLHYGVTRLKLKRFVAKIALDNAPSLGLFSSLGFAKVSECADFGEATLALEADPVPSEIAAAWAEIDPLYLRYGLPDAVPTAD